MGVSWSSDVILGVKLKDLNPQEITKNEIVVRYDEITGKPYEKSFPKQYVLFGTKEYEGTLKGFLKYSYESFEEFNEEFNNDSEIEVNLWCTAYIEDINPKSYGDEIVIGVCIGGATEHNPINQIKLDNLHDLSNYLFVFLKEKFDYSGDTKLYNLLNVSY